MFTKVDIRMTGPLCTCREQNLGWTVINNNLAPPAKAGLRIFCKSCKVQLDIPAERFVATITLDTPYPGRDKFKPEENTVNIFAAKPPKERN